MPYELLLEEDQAQREQLEDSIAQSMDLDMTELRYLLDCYGSGLIEAEIGRWKAEVLKQDPPQTRGNCFFWNAANSSQALASESDCW